MTVARRRASMPSGMQLRSGRVLPRLSTRVASFAARAASRYARDMAINALRGTPIGRAASIAQTAYDFARNTFGGRRRQQNRTPQRPEARVGPRARRYATTGRMKERIKVKRKKDSAFTFNGCTVRVEGGGRVVDPQAVYLGHSTYSGQEWKRVVWAAIIKQLLRKAGIEIRSWEATWQLEVSGNTTNGDMFVDINYIVQGLGGAKANVNFPIVRAQTIWTVISNLVTALDTALLDLDAPVEFKSIQLLVVTAVGTSVQMASMVLDRTYVDLDCASYLKVQNTTLATAGTTGNDDDVGDIENNPMSGYLYESKLWCNYFEPTVVYNTNSLSPVSTSAGAPGAIAANFLGIITFAGYTNSYRKPPNQKSALKCHKMGKVLLQPGEIKYSKLRFKCSISLNTLYVKLGLHATRPGDTNLKVSLGNAAMFGLERTLDSRVSEAELRVAYQYDHVYKAKVRSGKVNTLALFELR